MARVQRFCVFCSKKSGNLINFTETNLAKCNGLLSLRKENNLAGKNTVLPKKVNDFELYHSKCYGKFTALPPKYRYRKEKIKESKVSTLLAKENHQEMISNAKTTEDISVSTEECVQTKCDGNVQQKKQLNESVCIFCDKKRKKIKGSEEKLRVFNEETINKLESSAVQLDDLNFLNKVNIFRQNSHIHYHSACQRKFEYKLRCKVSAQREETEWHRVRNINKKAYEEVCQFVSENIIKNQQPFSLSFLRTLFMKNIQEKNKLEYSYIKPYQLENRLKREFQKKIAIVQIDNKKIVKPYDDSLLPSDILKIAKNDQ
ncbi:hypothetical protein PV325_009274 [Microctonus aethiopoides]|uniref:Uncharacterized protein n=1 Tax=Microctonus aethiopoides TaxID=144406 RepID=A0AA39FHT4_9HYME|nr:hypothetical protein PV325_009274 [Microctonus aethiopoides]KAK0169788.1 hypothetical protein PV328_010429 [Microctonus aethiopoides]